jgi:hypothetical protein
LLCLDNLFILLFKNICKELFSPRLKKSVPFNTKLRDFLKNYFFKKKHIFAKEIGISSPMLSRYIGGDSMPSYHTACRINRITEGHITMGDMGYDAN